MLSSGLLDTSVIVHSIGNDKETAECLEFMNALASNASQATLDFIVLHELSYTLTRYRKQMTKNDVGEFLLWLVERPGIECDKGLFEEAISRWIRADGIGFVDAYLIARSSRERVGIYTKNVREFRVHGAEVIEPLLS